MIFFNLITERGPVTDESGELSFRAAEPMLRLMQYRRAIISRFPGHPREMKRFRILSDSNTRFTL